MTKNRAVLELIFAGVLWGFGFVATVWAMAAFTPTETLVYRFIAATVIGEVLYLIIKGAALRSAKEDFLRAMPAGAILGTMLLLQAIGLKFTTATKSGFITSLYVILVPLFNAWFFKNKSSWKNYALAGVALLGTFILMDANLSGINYGDLWTVACSILAAFHIIYIGKISNKVGNAFRFNNFQSFWSLLILPPLLFMQDHVTWRTSNTEAIAGLLALGLGSSIIAFYLQVRTQRILSDTTASMLFLLESPFAAIFGFFILNERLTVFQTSGAVIIMIASVMQILWDPSSKTPEMKPPR